MDRQHLSRILSHLPLGDIRYFDSIGSTNDEASAWAADGAPDLSVVIADEQTAGRGRLDRRWFTPPATALAFSLILRLDKSEVPYLSRIVGLAALSVSDALGNLGLAPQIKWPNDILLNGQKVAGILVESNWIGEKVDYVIAGIGLNVAQDAVPSSDMLQFPATSLEHILGGMPDRFQLLHDILASFIALRPHLHTSSFLAAWEKSLAYHGMDVRVDLRENQVVMGKIEGLEVDGSLRVMDEHGRTVTVRFGDVRLRLFA